MKHFVKLFVLVALLGFAGFSLAEPVVESTVANPGGSVAVEIATSAAPATIDASVAVTPPTVNKGDTAWMIMATVLVILMVIPGLALFYGGMVRAKNMLSVLMQVFVIFSMMAVLWAIYGYSIAFTEGTPFFGGFSKMFLFGITPDSVAATFSKGVYIPEYIYVAFQLTFAGITPALIIGAFAERVKFSAILVFMLIWCNYSDPLAKGSLGTETPARF